MSWGAVGTAVVGAVASSQASKGAADAAMEGQQMSNYMTMRGLALQQEEAYNLRKLAEPFRMAGQRGLAQYEAYTQDPSAMYQDPTYQAMLEQGTRAVEGSAAAKGTQLSGRTLASLQDLGMSTASQYRSQIMGELANLANIGSTAVGQAAGIGGQQMQQTGAAYQNLANLAQQTGQIQAGAIMGQGTALANLAGTLGSAYMKYNQTPSTPAPTPGLNPNLVI